MPINRNQLNKLQYNQNMEYYRRVFKKNGQLTKPNTKDVDWNCHYWCKCKMTQSLWKLTDSYRVIMFIYVTTMVQQSYSLGRRNENPCPRSTKTVHCSLTHNSSKMETTQMSLNRFVGFFKLVLIVICLFVHKSTPNVGFNS